MFPRGLDADPTTKWKVKDSFFLDLLLVKEFYSFELAR